MKNLQPDEIRKLVQQAYGQIAIAGETGQTGCGCGCDGPDPDAYARSLGYSDEELKAIPASANLALSCGNPTALAGLSAGETVLDLGAGAGFDCFLAADRVGAAGRVIGVDMTAEMVEKARANARENGIENVDFRLAEIESLPVEDESVDVIISNCVINLSPDKKAVFSEMRRVLKPGGRIAISDIVLRKELPDKLRGSLTAYTGCVSGANGIDEFLALLQEAGFREIGVETTASSCGSGAETSDPIGRIIADSLGEGESLECYIASAYITSRK